MLDGYIYIYIYKNIYLFNLCYPNRNFNYIFEIFVLLILHVNYHHFVHIFINQSRWTEIINKICKYESIFFDKVFFKLSIWIEIIFTPSPINVFMLLQIIITDIKIIDDV